LGLSSELFCCTLAQTNKESMRDLGVGLKKIYGCILKIKNLAAKQNFLFPIIL
jgi:hypothetical protein